MKVKTVTVKDEGTCLKTYFVMMPETVAEIQAYDFAGWDPERLPLLIVELGPGGYASAVISTFRYPPYDIGERSVKMDGNGTNLLAVTLMARAGFDDMPSHIDEETMASERRLLVRSGDKYFASKP